MINSILDPIYNILLQFFPTEFLNDQFIKFLITMFMLYVSVFIFSLFFIYPLKIAFTWIKNIGK